MGLSAPLLSQQGLISSASQPNMGFLAPPISLTWAYQQRYSANKGLSALLSQHGLISTAYQPDMGLSAPPISLTWAHQLRLSA